MKEEPSLRTDDDAASARPPAPPELTSEEILDITMVRQLVACRHPVCEDRRTLVAWLRAMRRNGQDVERLYALATRDVPDAPSLEELLASGGEMRRTDRGT